MVTRTTGKLPIPKSADEFEDIATDALRIRYPHRSLTRLGRSGQPQHGIDGLDQQSANFVWQSTLQKKGTLEKIKGDLARMDAKFEGVETYVTCLGFERDKTLQLGLRKISGQRQLDGKCAVEALFWEDLTDSLANDPTLFAKHFPQHSPSLLQDELAKASLEDRYAARRPHLHLEFKGSATTAQRQKRFLFIHNVGSCRVLVTSAKLHWRVDAPGAVENTVPLLVSKSPLNPSDSTETEVRMQLKDVEIRCEALELARPDTLAGAPIVGEVVIEAKSAPHDITERFSLPYTPHHSKVPEAEMRVINARQKIMEEAYRKYVESPKAQIIFQGPEEYPGWLKDIAREASYLKGQGWIEVWGSMGNSITKIRLTAAGRDAYESEAHWHRAP